jgi:hypothetical protein
LLNVFSLCWPAPVAAARISGPDLSGWPFGLPRKFPAAPEADQRGLLTELAIVGGPEIRIIAPAGVATRQNAKTGGAEMATNYDGGEAILEAFRSLGVEHIISSPGSEWSPVWEALARQKTGNRPGPDFIECWHETLAVNMAMGFTQYTGKMQAVLLHAGVGLMQGEMGIHTARNYEVPMVVMSGESVTYGEDPTVEPGEQWYGSLGIVAADVFSTTYEIIG